MSGWSTETLLHFSHYASHSVDQARQTGFSSTLRGERGSRETHATLSKGSSTCSAVSRGHGTTKIRRGYTEYSVDISTRWERFFLRVIFFSFHSIQQQSIDHSGMQFSCNFIVIKFRFYSDGASFRCISVWWLLILTAGPSSEKTFPARWILSWILIDISSVGYVKHLFLHIYLWNLFLIIDAQIRRLNRLFLPFQSITCPIIFGQAFEKTWPALSRDTMAWTGSTAAAAGEESTKTAPPPPSLPDRTWIRTTPRALRRNAWTSGT